jgi:hypothetical protein
VTAYMGEEVRIYTSVCPHVSSLYLLNGFRLRPSLKAFSPNVILVRYGLITSALRETKIQLCRYLKEADSTKLVILRKIYPRCN